MFPLRGAEVKTILTKQEFIEKWNSGADGGGITNDDVAECASYWGLVSSPRIYPVDYVIDIVLKHLNLTRE